MWALPNEKSNISQMTQAPGGYVKNETSMEELNRQGLVNDFAPAAQNSFEMPTDIMPYSGLPQSYRDQLLGFVMPQLQGSLLNQEQNINRFQQDASQAYTPVQGTYTPIDTQGAYTPVDMQGTYTPVDTQGAYTPVNMQGTYTPVDFAGTNQNIDEGAQAALSGYQQQLNNYLKNMIPKDINQLANRGVLNSTVASDTLAGTLSRGATDASTRGYETLMAAAGQKANLSSQAALQASASQSAFAQNAALQNASQQNQFNQNVAFQNASQQNQFNQQAALQNASQQNQFNQNVAFQNASQQNQFNQQAALQNASQQNQQQYNTAMQSLLTRNSIPNTLAGLLQYGSSSQDPTVMYQTMAQLLASL